MKPTKFILAALVATLSLSCTPHKDAKPTLRYHEDGTFRIAQLTDIHWCDDSTTLCQMSLESMEPTFSEGQPDLVVITGDVVTDAPIIKGWHSIIEWLDSHKVPYLVQMGNHDAEFFVNSREELLKAREELGADPTEADDDVAKHYIYKMLMQSPYYIGDLGHEVSGWGNVAVPIYGSQDPFKVKNVIYMIDSHDYPVNRLDGYYDWIHTDQVAWYRDRSAEYSAANGGRPVPSLAFFHIPLQEQITILNNDNTFGIHRDSVDPGDINSGFFASCYENDDVMGIFTGHDHSNDYVGVHHGIALGFGRVGGWNASGHLERGGRIIELTEDSRCFSTAVITPSGREATVWLPSCSNSIEEQDATFLPALDIAQEPHEHGVSYKYYEGEWESVTEFEDNQKVSEGTMDTIDVTGAPIEDHFGYVFDALINTDIRGFVNFKLYSDDGAQLYVDGQLVINNDGSHSTRHKSGRVALEQGYHHLQVRYFEDSDGQRLGITISSKHIPERPLSNEDLYIIAE